MKCVLNATACPYIKCRKDINYFFLLPYITMYRSYAISSSKSKWKIFITHLKEIKIQNLISIILRTTDPNNLPSIPTNSLKIWFQRRSSRNIIVKEIIFMASNQRKVIDNSSNKVTQPKQRRKKFNVLPIAGNKNTTLWTYWRNFAPDQKSIRKRNRKWFQVLIRVAE